MKKTKICRACGFPDSTPTHAHNLPDGQKYPDPKDETIARQHKIIERLVNLFERWSIYNHEYADAIEDAQIYLEEK